MAGTNVPAMDGPAGQERGQDAADGAVIIAARGEPWRGSLASWTR